MKRTDCKRCNLSVREQEFWTENYIYDIGEALYRLKLSPRPVEIIPAVTAFRSARLNTVHLRHVEHVSDRHPVIAIRSESGGLDIIDGSHRAWRRLFRRLPIRAYILTPDEAAAIRRTRKRRGRGGA